MNTFALLASFCITLLLFIKIFYQPTVSALRVDPCGSCSLVSVKPKRKWFRDVSSGLPIGTVRLAGDIVAVYTVSDSSKSLSFKSVNFSEPIYLFRKTRFKYRSVDLSDRSFNDVILKFKFSEDVLK